MGTKLSLDYNEKSEKFVHWNPKDYHVTYTYVFKKQAYIRASYNVAYIVLILYPQPIYSKEVTIGVRLMFGISEN